MKFKLLSVLIALFLFNCIQTYAENSDIKWMKSGHIGNTQILYVSNDGEYVVTTGNEKTIKVINTKNDSLIFKINTNDNIVFVKITPDKSTIIIGSKSTEKSTFKLITYDIEKQNQTDSITIKSAYNFQYLNISNDNKYIAGILSSYIKRVYIWDAKSGKNISAFDTANKFKAYSYSFSPVNNNIAIVYDSSLKIYDYSSNILVKEINIKSNAKTIVSYNHDGIQLIVYNIDGNISMYDVNTGDIKNTNKVEGISIVQVIMTKDPSKLIIIGSDKQCYIWDFNNNELIKKLGIVTDNSNLCLFNYEKGLLYISGINGDVKEWDINTDKLGKYLTNNYSYIYFCNKGKNIINKYTSIFAIENGNTIYESNKNIYALKDTNVYCYSKDSVLYIYNFDNNQVIDSINFHQIFNYLIFSDNLKYCCFRTNENKKLSNIMDWEKKKIIFSDTLDNIKFSNNNQYAVYHNATKEQLVFIDLIKAKIIYKLDIHNFSIRSFCFSPDSKYYFLQKYGENSKMYSMEDMSLIKEFKSSTEPKFNSIVKISPDSKYLVDAAGNVDLRIWDIESGNLIYTYLDYEVGLYSMDISSDSKYILASYQDGTAILRYAKFGSTSVENNKINNLYDIKITPNPTKGIFTVSIPNIEQGISAKLNITDFSGNKLFTLPIKDTINTIDLSKHPNGTYFLTIVIGEQSRTFKIMKVE